MTGVPHPRDQPVDTSKIQSIRMGTTVATNALLERNGERTVLVTTQGFHDLLYIGNQSRPKIFDLEIHMPDVSTVRFLVSFTKWGAKFLCYFVVIHCRRCTTR